MREGVPEDMRIGDLFDGYPASLPEGDNKDTSARQLLRQGVVGKNPISSTPGYKREGRNERRKGTLSDEDRRKAEEYADAVFRPVLVALRETGARPSEICRAKVERVDLAKSCVLVPNKVAHLTGVPERTIYLSLAAKELVERQIGRRTEG